MKRQDKIKDFNHLDKSALRELLLEKREKLRQLKFDLSAGKIKNVREIRETRRDIARLNTLLRTKLTK
ncbi:50S ribosomal protein L29 [bacterium (Candidatus Gribaldobacteria) CG08_land_8_20_14_0_20_39_15]|uniref:Large ribosomal subunit protein uL29 n=1 Tax=bacterium (Candidatus Gribaldobacteria) CG08_land_8_20_14_0_20_39_15 TaxID=2014273 RepID=A0A2M6XV02_9BACT|nr:MAG: 50S ribosomal protein L29 [bacterium (Candidatus Gribaldobacteria) CG08_land_8_20_14_0_20_39_15]